MRIRSTRSSVCARRNGRVKAGSWIHTCYAGHCGSELAFREADVPRWRVPETIDEKINKDASFCGEIAVWRIERVDRQIVRLVSETVKRWDARTVTDRIESAVGRDLQFIRINGTLVGGIVG
ncbi:MAG: DUF445 family protein, partial [Variovorax sp.]|nr:DUF445 family protein [Variovorax sp.]